MNTLQIGSRRLYYTDEGRGPAVMLLHGARAVEDAWDQLIPVLVTNGFRVVYPYRAGRGGSDPHAGDLTLTKDSQDALQLLDHLGIETTALIGHSQGAFVMQQMVLAAPDRFSAVVSVDSMSFGKFTNRKPLVDRFDAATRLLYEKHRDELRRMEREWDHPSDYNVERYSAAWDSRLANPEQWEAEQQKPCAEDLAVPEGKYCTVPLLVFACGRGRFRQADPEAVELAESLPGENAELVAVTDSGHSIQREQPALFNAKVVEFLTCALRPSTG
jgi:pimeloyl-ACP methyl ester carboxylesterase